jgi:hypothetical protein
LPPLKLELCIVFLVHGSKFLVSECVLILDQRAKFIVIMLGTFQLGKFCGNVVPSLGTV